MRRRIPLAHLPTPIQRPRQLVEATGIDLWVKRDDITGGPEAGNKIRKLEFLLAEALSLECDTVITCGGEQSNHARATALCAASLGLKSILYLRTEDMENVAVSGNLLLGRLAGADVRFMSPGQWPDRNRLMDQAAEGLLREGRRAYVIPEGGSNGLGALGYVEAMAEVRRQIDLGLGGGKPYDAVVYACGSGGTAAGVALGAAMYGVAREAVTMAVCYDKAYFEARIMEIVKEARQLDSRLPEPAPLFVYDGCRGPAYAVMSVEQRKILANVTRLSGLVFDPAYTGKAFAGLVDLAKPSGPLAGKRVLFLHTGGLPGLLAQADEFASILEDEE